MSCIRLLSASRSRQISVSMPRHVTCSNLWGPLVVPDTYFPQFAQLPPELRLIVWEMAVEEPRDISFFAFPTGHTPRTLTVGGVNFYDAPLFFFVNRECRSVAMKAYTNVTVRIADTGSLHIDVDVKAKCGDGFRFWCDHKECPRWYQRLVESKTPGTVSVDPEFGHAAWFERPTCKMGQSGDWVLTLQSDGCISRDSLDLWRILETEFYVTVAIRHPFLSRTDLQKFKARRWTMARRWR
ncbi:hypothetical protein F4679DRAFT_548144 [Xylaria curta]|nr:hypothetical protein F4679DRAFT_548144 [Xylaria curta]